MDIISLAFESLFNKPCPYSTNLKYSGKFKGYNANLRLQNNILIFNLSRQWLDISDDIKIGLIQELLVKMFKKKFQWKKRDTLNMELYAIFLKKVHLTIPKTHSHPILERSFNRVNNKYFFGILERPNLIWGSFSHRQLGSYDFGTDTVKISKILHPDNASEFLLDYVMYHELLHKKNKFISKAGRTRTHTKDFKMQERKFENSHLAEKQLSRLSSRRKSFFERLWG